MATPPPMSIQERVDAVLRRQKPDRLPFIDRLEVWYRCPQPGGHIAGAIPRPVC